MTQTLDRTTPPVGRGGVNRTRTRTVAFACLAMFTSYLPFSAVNGALGAIGSATRASTADLQWVTDAFALVLAAAVLSAGALADRLGGRTVTLAGLALTALGSGLGLLAPVFGTTSEIRVLWFGLGIAGLGGGAVMSATLGLVAAVSPEQEARRRAIALWAAAVTAGLGSGPFLVAVTSRESWSTFFAPILVLVVGVAGFGVRTSLESTGTGARRVDVAGQLTSFLAIAAVGYAVIRGGSHGWTDAGTVLAGVVAVGSGIAFAVAERRAATPLLRTRLFASRNFDAAGLASATTLFATVATVFSLSLLFAHDGASSLQIACRLACLFAANALAGIVCSRPQIRVGQATVLVVGLLVMAAGTLMLVTAQPGAGFADYAWRLALTGAGSGMVMATASAVAVSAAPPDLAGLAGAVNNAVRQLGAALGAAVIGSILAARLSAGASFTAAVHTCSAVLAALLSLAAAGCVLLLRRIA